MPPSLFIEAPDSLEEQRSLVALSLIPGVGPGRIRALVAAFGSAAAALAAPARALAEVPGIGMQTAAAIARFDAFDQVEAQLRQAERLGTTMLAPGDAGFPALLRQIYDPPAFLWTLGELRAEDACAVAIVGTRRASDYGRRVAHELATGLAERGVTVVSGLAYGIDAAAHRAALQAGGRTLAVLGSGLDRIYPGRHAGLAREIAAAGAVVSEYPFGTGPDAPNFPRRNRIVSGLALGTVVVEAYETGGALITARLALEQNREVFAVPGSIHCRSADGANRLIQQGHAKLVQSVDDILVEIGGLHEGAERPTAQAAPVVLSEVEQRLYDVLDASPRHIDVVCARTGLDASTALVYLLSLEFKGLVRQMAGQQYFRSG